MFLIRARLRLQGLAARQRAFLLAILREHGRPVLFTGARLRTLRAMGIPASQVVHLLRLLDAAVTLTRWGLWVELQEGER
jgi:hypothetical protein